MTETSSTKSQELDSKEEQYFVWYLDELKSAGVIEHWERPQPFILADNVQASFGLKPKKRVILRSQIYTPDFLVVWSPAYRDRIFSVLSLDGVDSPKDAKALLMPAKIEDGKFKTYLEVKGGFTDHDESRIYSILKKWVFAKYQVLVHTVKVSSKPDSIFAKTFCPKNFLTTDKTKKPRKINFNPKSLDDYLCELPH